MKLRSFVLGVVALVALSSCNSKATDSPQAGASPRPQAVSQVEPQDTVAEPTADPGEERLLTLEEANAAAEGYDYDQDEPYEIEDGSSGSQVSASTESSPATVEKVQALSRQVMKMAQGNMQLTRKTYEMAQQVGDQSIMQSSQNLMQLHQQAYSEFESAAKNPEAYLDPASSAQLLSRSYEYLYRASKGDMRPTDQIQGELTAFRQQIDWEGNTAEGRAYAKAKNDGVSRDIAQFGDTMTRNHNRNMANIASSAKAHQDKMDALHSTADARDAAWKKGQKVNEEAHGQRVGAVYENYEYVNPNTGEHHWIPASNTNPSVTNDDGSVTELQPYRPSDNY